MNIVFLFIGGPEIFVILLIITGINNQMRSDKKKREEIRASAKPKVKPMKTSTRKTLTRKEVIDQTDKRIDELRTRILNHSEFAGDKLELYDLMDYRQQLTDGNAPGFVSDMYDWEGD